MDFLSIGLTKLIVRAGSADSEPPPNYVAIGRCGTSLDTLSPSHLPSYLSAGILGLCAVTP